MSRLDSQRALWLARHILPHEPALRAWLKRRRHLPLEIDDIVQEAYVILAQLDSVDHIYDAKSYFYQTAHSLVLRELRKTRVVSINVVDDLEALGIESSEPSPETQVSDRQQLQILSDALDRLPAQCRAVFKLRKIEGASQREIAARMGLSESTVEKHIARAVRLMMDWFAHGGNHPFRASNQGKATRRHHEQAKDE